MARPEDSDILFMESIAALAINIRGLVEKIKDDSDNPDVLRAALHIESDALIIQRRIKDFYPRLRELKGNRR